MTITADRAPGDVRALLGMHTVGARVVLAAFVLAMGTVAFSVRPEGSSLWPPALSIALLTAIAVMMITIPGDPMPLGAAIPMTIVVPAICWISLLVSNSPPRPALQGWAHGATTIVLSFMCVRGRTTLAWIGLAFNLLTYGWWFSANNLAFGGGIAVVITDLGPVALSSVFALTLRPTAKAVFDLRDAGTRRAAELAARTASAAERDTQLAELDKLARPMLDRIASGATLTDAERTTCELMEAHLRDRLRAPGLVTPDVADAVRSARARGVEVILIDDCQADPLGVAARDRIHTEVIRTLFDAQSGDVRVRLMPPHRAAAASIYVRDAVRTYRREFDHAGAEVLTVATPVEN